ncbi:DUF7848 domain-containing protein [Actinacidiphila soli]
MPVAIFSVACIACREESEATDNERLPVEVWALKHTGLNPMHRQYQQKGFGTPAGRRER